MTRDKPKSAPVQPIPNDLAPGLFTATLDNGLRVIIREDHRSPVAVCNAWVRVGSNREPDALRGWSHGIEHMLFKGTARRDEGDFAREVAEAGGATNAGTGYETTNYHITVPAEQLRVAVDILGDALFNSRFERASLDAERQVLVHENHMYDDVAFGFGITWRWGLETAFDVSPYRHPIGGRDENLLERDRREVMAFWRSAYRPDNMTVVIVGDVDPAKALDLVAAAFGPARPDGALVSEATGIVTDPPTEPPHTACRLRVETGDIQKAYAKLVFPAPGDGQGLAPEASVTRRILGEGRSCRLYRHLQEELKLVDHFSLAMESGRREGVVVIDLETDPVRMADALVETARIVDALGRDGCDAAELDRAKTKVLRSYRFGSETVLGQASTLGQYDAQDDLPGAFAFADRVVGIGSGDVRAYCDAVFRRRNATAMIYLPHETDPQAHGIPTSHEDLDRLLSPVLRDSGLVGWPAAAKRHDAPAAPAAGHARTSAPVFETIRLTGGVELNCRVDRAVPVLATAFTLHGGACDETARDAGLAALTQTTQIKGTGKRDAAALHQTLENEGAVLSPLVDRDYGGLVLTGLSDRFDRALALAAEVILEPSFPADEVEQEKRLGLEQLASMADMPFQAASRALRELVYGDHPYGRPLQGTEDSIPTLRREDLVTHHRRLWHTGNLQITVSGAFDPDRLAKDIEELLADLPVAAPTDAPEPGPARVPESVESITLNRKQKQAVVLSAWPGPATIDEHRVPLMLLKEILNGQSGRLFEELRNRRSLCYNTGLVSTAGFGQGMVVGYVLTAPESAAEARDVLNAELAAMADGPPDAAEFARARARLLGNLLIASQSNGSRVGRALRDRIYGRNANHLDEMRDLIGACGADEVTAAAAAIIDPGRRFDVSLGPDGS